MSSPLHLCALALAVVAAGSLIAVRRSVGVPEAAAAVLMLAGMTDAMTASLLPPVVWFGALTVAGLCLAARLRATAGTDGRSMPSAEMLSGHLALGLVATAALILLMPDMPASTIVTSSSSSSHSHGGSTAMPQVLGAALGIGSLVLAAIALRRERAWQHRLHHIAMAASTIAMCAVVIL